VASKIITFTLGYQQKPAAQHLATVDNSNLKLNRAT